MRDNNHLPPPSPLGPLTFGFDIGIASVGWAVLSPTRIVDLGVRAFDAAEEPKTGASLNEHRRIVKSQRNRLRRRVQRLKRLRRMLRDAGTVPSADVQCFIARHRERNSIDTTSPWALRAYGLDHLLAPNDWAQVIYHIVKHRGEFDAVFLQECREPFGDVALVAVELTEHAVA